MKEDSHADWWDEDEGWDVTELIREERLASEFCPHCGTRHHPDRECQEEYADE